MHIQEELKLRSRFCLPAVGAFHNCLYSLYGVAAFVPCQSCTDCPELNALKTILPLNVITECHSARWDSQITARSKHIPRFWLTSRLPFCVLVREGGQCSKLYIFGNCVTLKLLYKQNFILKLLRNIFTECVGIFLLLEPATWMGADRKSHHLVWITITELGMCIIKILMKRK